MTIAERLLLGLALAASVAYAATPYAIRIADRLQFYDQPFGYKGHARPTPYLGGAAVMTGFAIAVLLAAGDLHRSALLLAGIGLLWAVGTVDDRRTVPPALRVAVEVALGAAVWAGGLGWDLHIGALPDLVLTCLWIVAVVNAFNLFDNMDGAASTMGLVACAGIVLLGVLDGRTWLPIAAVALAGACLGFLPRNVSSPARVFLGDGGSMPLGFAVAFLAMHAGVVSVATWRSPVVALLLVGVPAIDTCSVIVSRRRRGISLLTGGRDHLTHRTRRLLPSARAVAFALGAVQAVVSAFAVLVSLGGTSEVVLGAILYALAAAGAIVAFEYRDRTLQEREPPADAGQPGEGEARSTAPETHSRTLKPTRRTPSGGRALLASIGLGAGLSPFAFAYYDASVWVPIGMALALAAAIAVVARPPRLAAPGALAVGGLLGIGVFSLASAAWAEGVDRAVVSGNRWLLYGALLLLLVVLVRSRRDAAWMLAFAAAGLALLAFSVLARLLGGDPAALFLDGRLNAPLGYINGEGCLFAMGFWLFLAVAESRRALLAAPAAGIATLMACMAVLAQSRGTALALLGTLVVVVAIVPGRTRRLYLLLVIATGVILAEPSLSRVYDAAAGDALPPAVGHAAGRAALLAALGAGLLWALFVTVWRSLVARGVDASALRRGSSWLLAVPAVLALALGIASAPRLGHEARAQWRAFTELSGPSPVAQPGSSGDSRLLSGGGHRYDYWRIAWGAWRAHPLLGVGAGNYARSYYQRRATTEDVEQPHSIELQVLSELGLPGALLLACLLLGAFLAAFRMRAGAASSRAARGLMVAALGSFVAWLLQTSVDWMHLLPGVTALALLALAALLAPGALAVSASQADGRSQGRSPLSLRRGPAFATAALLATLVLSGASLSRQGLADLFRARAEGALASNPGAALSDVDRSLDFDADAVQSYYVEAASLARLHRAEPAEAALRQALEREPGSFVTWTLLGDIAVREGRAAVAGSDYRIALRFNPRNVGLRRLAADPLGTAG